ncbi:MAG: DUF3102 domain-containing protein [Cyanobacteria bacterium P01_D01_bin.56]
MGNTNQQLQSSTLFDYASLRQDHRLVIQQHTGEIRKRLRRSAQDVWEIGQRLSDVRSRLKYGEFLIWLKAEFGWSQRTAYNFINVYETFGDRFAKLANVDLATSVLYQLASPSVPEELRTQVLDAAATGKKVSHNALKAAIKQSKADKDKESQIETSGETKVKKPEIVSLIPKAAREVKAELLQSASKIEISPGWYRLGDEHWIFCGDTASRHFVQMVPSAKLAIAVTTQDWAHDWLVDQVDNLVILAEAEFTLETLEQLLQLLSKTGDSVVLPWLPLPDMIKIAHNLGRRIYGGDAYPLRCQRAVMSSGLELERFESERVVV